MAQKELDRFDKNAKRNMRLSTKLSLMIAVIVIGCCVIVEVLAIRVFSSRQLAVTEADIEHTAVGAERVLNDWVETLKGYSELTAMNPQVISACEDRDAQTLRAIVDQTVAKLDLEFMAITDSSGIVIPGASRGIKSGMLISQLNSVSDALRGKSSTSFETIGDAPYAAVNATPIYSDGRIVGTAVFAFNLASGEFTNLMSESYDVDCSIIRDTTIVSSSLAGFENTRLEDNNSAEMQQILSTVRSGRNYSGLMQLPMGKFFGVYTPLKCDNGTITGMLFIAKSMVQLNSTKIRTISIISPVISILAIVLVFLGYMFIRRIMWRISNVTKFLMELETGDADLTKRCKLFIRDEIGDLIIHFDLFMDKLQEIIRDVKNSKQELGAAGNTLVESTDDTAAAITQILANIESMHGQINNQSGSVNQTASSVNQIASNIESLERMIERQGEGVSQASAAVEEMIGNIKSVNGSVDKMVSSFSSLQSNTKNGISKQLAVDEQIKQIETQSQLLNEANVAISNIAEQTNLLAMNAAIEAAHAGEAGKGFAVVADEIRKLSETSSSQSKTIGEQLKNIQKSIETVVSASSDASSAFARVSDQIANTDQLVSQIKSAMEEQQAGSEQITQTLHSMNDSSIEVRNSASEMNEGNRAILKEVSRLQELTQAMDGSMEEMSAGASKINQTGAELSTVSGQVKESIQKIGEQIDLFKV